MGGVDTIFRRIISISTAKAMCANGFLWAKLDKRADNEAHGIVSVADNKW